MRHLHSETVVALEAEMAAARSRLEGRGIQIHGHGGESKDGPYWHYEFTRQWPLPPDRGSSRVGFWWGPMMFPEMPDKLEIQRIGEIFREGQPSNFREVASRVVTSAEVLNGKLEGIVIEELRACEQAVDRRSNTSVERTREG